MSYIVDLVGEDSCGLVVPGDERSICWVSAHTIRARNEILPTSQKEDVQGLLDPCFVHFHHLEAHKHTCVQSHN